MSDLGSIGRWILLAGVGLVIFGGLLWLIGRSGLPLGRLPGDIRIEREGFSCFFPLASSLLLSLLLTIALNLLARWLNR